ncbi:hypothetical protein NBRC10512_007463 [Rhodotorula toruloides]|uniref:RHTO0S33e00518g1_1 n=2 Tax=Rhodotorula toruloides TaxID=5286 RepID=A0A061BRV4_RHOTO|nr:uncharacterized protein RHTO_06667 [Rhodotorula toruloides NP11]EMS18122.1 hypothetical protein RHTO_06667 [Rhodotorula toruloides NP11]CDR49800.1 RHTO0S33e00518g1_1 [Rhodotorula toruloides]
MAKCLAHAYHTGRLTALTTSSRQSPATPLHFGLTDSEVHVIRAHLQGRVANQQAEAAARTLVGMSQQHSLLKPEISRRVALMHGTTKQRWERQARAF